MKEGEFVNWILDLAVRGGWRAWHVPAPMRAIPGGRLVPEPRARGLCDLVLMHDRPPRLLLVEAKNDERKLEPEQAEFLRLARGVVQLLQQQRQGAREVLHAAGVDPAHVEVVDAAAIPIGVYTWRPVNRPMIEAVLMHKVAIA